MPRAIAIAVDAARQMFALEDAETGFCGVFVAVSGPTITPGDVLDVDIGARGTCTFDHSDGPCVARALIGPISRLKAVVLVDGPAGGK
jgi:hypothetical protein